MIETLDSKTGKMMIKSIFMVIKNIDLAEFEFDNNENTVIYRINTYASKENVSMIAGILKSINASCSYKEQNKLLLLEIQRLEDENVNYKIISGQSEYSKLTFQYYL